MMSLQPRTNQFINEQLYPFTTFLYDSGAPIAFQSQKAMPGVDAGSRSTRSRYSIQVAMPG